MIFNLPFVFILKSRLITMLKQKSSQHSVHTAHGTLHYYRNEDCIDFFGHREILNGP